MPTRRFRRCPASLRRDLERLAFELQDAKLALYTANLSHWSVGSPSDPYAGAHVLTFVAERLGKLALRQADGTATMVGDLWLRKADPTSMPDPTVSLAQARIGADIAALLGRVWREMDREMRTAFAENPRARKVGAA